MPLKKHKFGVKDAVGQVKQAGMTPPPGAYLWKINKMELGPNSKGNDMITVYLETTKMPPKLKAYEGFERRYFFNLTDQGAPYFNAFLNAVAGSDTAGLKIQKDMWENGNLATAGKPDASETDEVVQIGVWKPKGRLVGCSLLSEPWVDNDGNEREGVTLGRFFPSLKIASSGGEEDIEDDDDLSDDEDLGDDDDGLDDDDDEEATLREELKDLDLKSLRLKARDDYDIPAPETKGKDPEDIIDMIVSAHFGGDEDDLDDGDDELEPEPKDPWQPEPEPEPKPVARKRATKRPAKKRAAGDDPPF